VLRPGGAEDQDVVEEDEDEVTQERAEYVIHQGLECGWCVA
jgi:hypothetical protein